jgi:DNA polymerase-3 subunit gamma/tau
VLWARPAPSGASSDHEKGPVAGRLVPRMQYTVLARKYRPQQFDDLVGQEHISRTLKNAIAHQRVAHAYLFVGPRGIGKTSAARILAKALVCEHGPTETPCGVCSSCREVAAGTNLDVLEIDGASNRGIDEVRAIRDNVRYSPSHAPYKIYIIDEVHQITRDAFNALLKTLEEPPPHVKFFFATTEAHKVPTTILSRCQRFDLRRIPTPAIVQRLQEIAAAEKIDADPRALQAIARAADGGMRDALSTLDQLIAFCGERIGEDDVLTAHGLASRDQLLQLATATLSGALEDAFAVIQDSYQAGRDLHRILLDMVALFRDLVVVKAAKQPKGLVDLGQDEIDQLTPLIGEVSLDRLVRILDLFSVAEGRLRQVISHRALLEMTVIKASQLASQPSINEVLAVIQKLRETGPDFKAGGVSRPNPPPTTPAPPRPTPPTSAPQTSAPEPRPRAEDAPRAARTAESDRSPAAGAPTSSPPPTSPPPARPNAPEPESRPREEEAAERPRPTPAAPRPAADAGAQHIPLSATDEIWQALLRRVEGSFVLRSILFAGSPVGLDGAGNWVIEFPDGSEVMEELTNKPDYLLLVGRFLERFSGEKVTVVARTTGGQPPQDPKPRPPLLDGPTSAPPTPEPPTPAAPDDAPTDAAEDSDAFDEEPPAEDWASHDQPADVGSEDVASGVEEPGGGAADESSPTDLEESAPEATASEPEDQPTEHERSAPAKSSWAARAADAIKRNRGRGDNDADAPLGSVFERLSEKFANDAVDSGEEGGVSGADNASSEPPTDPVGEGRRRFRTGLKRFEADPNVQAAIQTFEGELMEIQR